MWKSHSYCSGEAKNNDTLALKKLKEYIISDKDLLESRKEYIPFIDELIKLSLERLLPNNWAGDKTPLEDLNEYIAK